MLSLYYASYNYTWRLLTQLNIINSECTAFSLIANETLKSLTICLAWVV
jgi:hypothetical protein